MGKTLLVFFSRAGENYFAGEVRSIEKGNTKVLVEKILAMRDFDVVEVEMVNPYPNDYASVTEIAQEDLNKNARPEIKPVEHNVADYSNIILAYPNYWGTAPMAMFTFLEKYDWVGKNVFPLCTSEGSGLGNSLADIRKTCLGARISTGLSIIGGSVDTADATLEKWLIQNDLV